jgi:hypothetical protein
MQARNRAIHLSVPGLLSLLCLATFTSAAPAQYKQKCQKREMSWLVFAPRHLRYFRPYLGS